MLSIFYSDEFLEHDTGSYHPENSGRLAAVTRALAAVPWATELDWRSPKPIDLQDPRLKNALGAVHSRRYVAAVEHLARGGGGNIDADTIVSPRSYDVALLAVNAWLDGIDRVWETQSPAFALTRPPGHHALAERGMGFCIFSNAAIAAHYALEQSGIDRVGILDWDVHHGNGTQAIVETNPRIAFCSLHQSPLYPGTGAANERGCGNVLNLPLGTGSTIADYQPLFDRRVLPFFQDFQPDLLIVSAGYDANKADDLAGMALQPPDFGIFTRYALQISRRILFGLEGGYDFDALARSVIATIEPCLTPKKL